MTKADIVENVYRKVGFSKKEAVQVVELFFDLLKESLADHGKVKITGFGTFQVRAKRARRGRNPQTGEEMEIKARRVLTFKPSNLLSQSVNRERKRQ
jgi:integration host factor subunit alpha